MSDAQHLSVFKSGVDKWNQWRKANPGINPDLSNEQFGFMGSRLHRYSKPGVNTSGFSRFSTKDYSGADFTRTNLSRCIFREVILSNVNFQETNLSDSEFRQVSISAAQMQKSDIKRTNFILITFDEVNFEGAIFGQSYFGYSPIRNSYGLHHVIHTSPSHADFLTLRHSTELPHELVNHFGVESDYYGLITALRGDLYYDCFISYSTKDDEFVQLLRKSLIKRGVPCWFAPSDYRLNVEWFNQKLSDYELGRDLFNFIDAADAILLVLSIHSLNSDWVNEEMIRSYQVRRIIPISLGDINSHQINKERLWYNSVLEKGIINFRSWKDQETFDHQIDLLSRLLTKN